MIFSFEQNKLNPSNATHTYMHLWNYKEENHAHISKIFKEETGSPMYKTYIAQKLVNWLARLCAWFKVHFDISHDYGGPKYYKLVKHEPPGTGFWPKIPFTIWLQTFVGENTWKSCQ